MFEYQLSKKEKLIKKNWLTCLLVSTVYGVLVFAFFIGFGINFNEPTITTSVLFIMLILFLSLIISLNYILYRCAYKKPGTTLLLISIILSCYSIYSGIVTMLTNILVLELHLISIIFTSWFIFASIRLRRLNKKIQIFQMINSEEYVQHNQALNDAKTTEELDSVYHRCLQNSPSFYKQLTPIYKERKAALEQ